MKIDRLMGILTILLQKERITAPELAERFEVNRRTISRDIDALCRAGIPVITYQGNGGGISIAEGFKLDKNVLTTDELANITAALKGIGSVSKQSGIERTLDKLRADAEGVVSLNEPIIIDLASHYKGQLTEKIEQIKQAILETRTIEFDYYYEKGESHRNIEPYYIVFQWSAWYVFGYCLLRNDWRLFKLTRLRNLETYDKKFIPREIPLEKQDFSSFYSDKTVLIAVFDPSVKYQLIETYGYECFIEINNGLLATISFSDKKYILSWLLGFGEKVKVLKPDYIADSLVNTAEKILASYNET